VIFSEQTDGAWIGPLPGDGLALIVEELEAGWSTLGIDGGDKPWDALVDGEPCPGAAELGLHPSWRHQQERARVVAVVGGVAAHQLVEGFASLDDKLTVVADDLLWWARALGEARARKDG
jgi:hypothetical protein